MLAANLAVEALVHVMRGVLVSACCHVPGRKGGEKKNLPSDGGIIPSCSEHKDTRQATIRPDLPLADGSLILSFLR